MTKVDKDIDALVAAADALAEHAEGILEDGCPKCGGDCASANPEPAFCPQREVMRDLTEYRAAREAVRKGTPPAFATSA